MTVLVVEDEAWIRDIYEKLLRDEGLTVIACCCAEEALAAVRLEVPHLVFTDLNMPGMNGAEMVQTMRAAGLHFRAILASADSPEHLELFTRAAWGFDAVLAKPFKLEDFHKAVRAVVAMPLPEET